MKSTLAKPYEKSETTLNGKNVIRISAADRELFEQHDLKIAGNDFLTIYRCIVYRGIKFTSELSKEISTIDYIVVLTNNNIGAVQFYTAIDFNLFALIRIYEVIETVSHFFKVKHTETKHTNERNKGKSFMSKVWEKRICNQFSQ